jgi:hypothetical protein
MFTLYNDSDFGGENNERRSATGFIFVLTGAVVD